MLYLRQSCSYDCGRFTLCTFVSNPRCAESYRACAGIIPAVYCRLYILPGARQDNSPRRYSLFLFLYRILAGTGPDGQVMTVWSVVLILLLYFILGILSWLFPILSRFTFGFTDLNRTALRLALGNILRSATMALLIGLGIAAFSRNFYFVFFAFVLVHFFYFFVFFLNRIRIAFCNNAINCC